MSGRCEWFAANLCEALLFACVLYFLFYLLYLVASVCFVCFGFVCECIILEVYASLGPYVSPNSIAVRRYVLLRGAGRGGGGHISYMGDGRARVGGTAPRGTASYSY